MGAVESEQGICALVSFQFKNSGLTFAFSEPSLERVCLNFAHLLSHLPPTAAQFSVPSPI